MRTIDLKGKDYVPVNERLKAFRANFKDYSLITKIIELTPDYCTIQAEIIDPNGIVRATGLAQEARAASFVNKTSYVENCETSAWGRALGNFGIGIDSAICTADELLLALNAQKEAEENQPKEPAKRAEFEKDATNQKRALNKAVKEGAENAPEEKKTLDERAQSCIDWLNGLTAEAYNAKPNSAKDRAHDIKDACLSSGLPELVNIGVKIADKLNEFEPPLDDVIPY